MFKKLFGHKKIPRLHQELVARIHEHLSAEGYKFFDAQMVGNLVATSLTAVDYEKALKDAHVIAAMFRENNISPQDAKLILELMVIKINESVNDIDMSDIPLKEVK